MKTKKKIQENSESFEDGVSDISQTPSKFHKRNDTSTFIIDVINFEEGPIASWTVVSTSNQDYYIIEWKGSDKIEQLFFSQKEFNQAKKKWQDLRINFLGGDHNSFPY